MLLALEGIAGAGKSTLRDRILADAHTQGIAVTRTGQFSWLAPKATDTLIRLRAGIPAASPDEAIEAACWDLSLHARHNLRPALAAGHLLADRLTLSTACLLALLHDRPVDAYVRSLAEQVEAWPDTTVLLTTPADLCAARIAARSTAPRFTENPDTARRLADLYDQAADAWTKVTERPVLRHPCATADDLALLAELCLDHMTTRPASP
jgi:thymidylate kinase